MTRWLARTPALQDVLRAYDAVQVTFEEFADHDKASKIAKFSSKFYDILGYIACWCSEEQNWYFADCINVELNAKNCNGCSYRAAGIY